MKLHIITKSLFTCLIVTSSPILSSQALAEAPNIQTPSPVIYLADNLDEKDKLGWCIDTKGRGFSDELQTHSCKPRGGDVQFSFSKDTKQIRSATFDNKCMTRLDPENSSVTFGLLDCEAENATQQFSIDETNGQIQPINETTLCVTVGQASQSAGPFMSRTLLLEDCSATDEKFKRWIVKEN